MTTKLKLYIKIQDLHDNGWGQTPNPVVGIFYKSTPESAAVFVDVTEVQIETANAVFMKQLVIDITPESSKGVFSFVIYDYPNPLDFHLLDKHDIMCSVTNIPAARIVDSSLTPVGISFPLYSTNPLIRRSIDRYSSSITIFTRSGNTSPQSQMQDRLLIPHFAKHLPSYTSSQLLQYLTDNYTYMNIPTILTYMKRLEEDTSFVKDPQVQTSLRLLSRHCTLGSDITKKLLAAVKTSSYEKVQSVLEMAQAHKLQHISEYGRATRMPRTTIAKSQGSFFPVIHCFFLFCILTFVIYALKYKGFFKTLKSV